MGIRGYDFDEFGEGLSAGATANLAAAVEFVREAIESDAVQESPATASGIPSRG